MQPQKRGADQLNSTCHPVAARPAELGAASRGQKVSVLWAFRCLRRVALRAGLSRANLGEKAQSFFMDETMWTTTRDPFIGDPGAIFADIDADFGADAIAVTRWS